MFPVNTFVSSCIWIIHGLTIPILALSLYRSIRNEVRNYTNSIIFAFNILFIFYSLFALILDFIPGASNWKTSLEFFVKMIYHMTLNWATVIALFTYGFLTASGRFPFRSFLAWSVNITLVMSLFSCFAIDQKPSDKTYWTYYLDIAISVIPLVIIWTSYFKVYRLITSGKLGVSIYSKTSALKIMWYSRITLICNVPHVLTDILSIVDLTTSQASDGLVQLVLNSDLKRLFYSVWALLNLWVDWYVMRVYRQEGNSSPGNRGRGFTRLSLLSNDEGFEYEDVL